MKGPDGVLNSPSPFGDDFHRLAHDDQTGDPRLNDAAIRIGLSAALIGELVYQRYVAVDGDVLWPPDVRYQPADELARRTLAQIMAEPETMNLRTWLDYFAIDSTERVTARLARNGHVTPYIRWRYLRRVTRHAPTDPNRAFMPTVRVSHKLRTGQPLPDNDLFLAGLAEATGLLPHVLNGPDRDAGARLRVQLDNAPKAMRDLLRHTKTAAGDAVLSYRA